ncbi:MAG: exodeoxyribonuclease VII large subunit [Planctomycetota bacterium]
MAAHPRHRGRLAHQRLDALARQLDAMSYRAVLRRGYTVTRLAGSEIVRSAERVGPGDVLETELIDGKVRSRVEAAGGSGRGRRPRAPGPADAPLFDGANDDAQREEDDV